MGAAASSIVTTDKTNPLECTGCDFMKRGKKPYTHVYAPAGTIPPIPASEIFADALKKLNSFRAMHGLAPLKLALGAASVTAMANAITIGNKFKESGCKMLTHTGNTGEGKDRPIVGQNTYAITLGGMNYTAETVSNLVSAAVDLWHDEMNSPTPYFDAETGKPISETLVPNRKNFTQLIWQGSTEVAFGLTVVECLNMPWLIVVANFNPPGNTVSPPGEFVKNVHRGMSE